MKKILYLFLFFLLWSCNKESGDPRFTIENLQGTFHFIQVQLEADNANFDFRFEEIETKRLRLPHCTEFQPLGGDSIKVFSQQLYQATFANSLNAIGVNLTYQPSMEGTGGTTNNFVLKDDDIEKDVFRAFDDEKRIYSIKWNATGGMDLEVFDGLQVSDDTIVVTYKVDRVNGGKVDIKEIHTIIRSIENPILIVPTGEQFCQ